MSERTLGELVDRLTILNVKLFMVQDIIHKAAKEGVGVDAETVKKLTSLNLERATTMTAIDQCFRDGLTSGRTHVDERAKIT